MSQDVGWLSFTSLVIAAIYLIRVRIRDDLIAKFFFILTAVTGMVLVNAVIIKLGEFGFKSLVLGVLFGIMVSVSGLINMIQDHKKSRSKEG